MRVVWFSLANISSWFISNKLSTPEVFYSLFPTFMFLILLFSWSLSQLLTAQRLATIWRKLYRSLLLLYHFAKHVRAWQKRNHHLCISQAPLIIRERKYFVSFVRFLLLSVLMKRIHTMYTRWKMENNWNTYRTVLFTFEWEKQINWISDEFCHSHKFAAREFAGLANNCCSIFGS